MKRFLSQIMLCIYLFLSTGMTVNMHYCGELLDDISLSSENSSCCCKVETAGCCTDQSVYLDIDIDQLFVKQHSKSNVLLAKVFSSLSFSFIESKVIELISNSINEGPPDSYQKVYLFHHQLLVYG